MVEQHIFNLLCLLTSVISLNAAEDSKYFSPSGVAMCEQLCLRTVGCGRFQYSFRHLSCGFLAENTTEQGQNATFKVFAPRKSKEKLDNLRGGKCPTMAMIFQSKRIGFICRIRLPKKQAMGAPKILFIKVERGDIKQMDTRDRTISQYLPAFKGASGMAYVPKFKRLVYCDRGGKLHMMALDGSNRQFIKENSLGVIGVAEDRVFIFTSEFSGKRIHYSMSPYGTKLTKITQSYWKPDCITVDMKRRRLYISSENRILNYNYMGTRGGTIYGNKGIIEPFSDWMYIVDKADRKFYRVSLTTFNKDFFRSKPRSLAHSPPCIINDKLYTLTIDCDIMIISKSTPILIRTSEQKMSMCTCCLIT